MANLVFGVDPGSKNLGFALVNFEDGVKAVKTQHIEVGTDYAKLTSILDSFTTQPISIVAIEKPIFAPGRMGTMYGIVEIIGILKYYFKCKFPDIKIVELAPTEIKKAVTGDGKAEKDAMYEAMERIYGKGVIDKHDKARYGAISKEKWSHETDALLCAYAGYNKSV